MFQVYERVYQPYNLQPVYVCYSSLLQPYSRGEITLNSTDPYDMPLIDPRYYEDPRDLRDVVEGKFNSCYCINISSLKPI